MSLNKRFQRKNEYGGKLAWLVMIGLVMIFVIRPCTIYSQDFMQRQFHLSPFLRTKAPITSVNIKNIYPHDTAAFTQGFILHQGFIFESTGYTGNSTLARKEITTGKIIQRQKIPGEYFAEGLAILKGRLYLLTWQNETVLIYEAKSLRSIKKIKYRGEGWGLTTDGRYLLMSNGTSAITVREPGSFQIVRNIKVHDGNMPVAGLNELEFIKGEIWANIFMEDMIVRICPRNGRVTGWVDLSTLRSYLSRSAQVDVLNGIAYDAIQDRIFVTGKYWPFVFEIHLSKAEDEKP